MLEMSTFITSVPGILCMIIICACDFSGVLNLSFHFTSNFAPPYGTSHVSKTLYVRVGRKACLESAKDGVCALLVSLNTYVLCMDSTLDLCRIVCHKQSFVQ